MNNEMVETKGNVKSKNIFKKGIHTHTHAAAFKAPPYKKDKSQKD